MTTRAPVVLVWAVRAPGRRSVMMPGGIEADAEAVAARVRRMFADCRDAVLTVVARTASGRVVTTHAPPAPESLLDPLAARARQWH